MKEKKYTPLKKIAIELLRECDAAGNHGISPELRKEIKKIGEDLFNLLDCVYRYGKSDGVIDEFRKNSELFEDED